MKLYGLVLEKGIYPVSIVVIDNSGNKTHLPINNKTRETLHKNKVRTPVIFGNNPRVRMYKPQGIKIIDNETGDEGNIENNRLLVERKLISDGKAVGYMCMMCMYNDNGNVIRIERYTIDKKFFDCVSTFYGQVFTQVLEDNIGHLWKRGVRVTHLNKSTYMIPYDTVYTPKITIDKSKWYIQKYRNHTNE